VSRSFRKTAKEVSVKKLAVTIFLAMLAGPGIPGHGFSQANFYQGKTIKAKIGVWLCLFDIIGEALRSPRDVSK
jgi:hypothetical protein